MKVSIGCKTFIVSEIPPSLDLHNNLLGKTNSRFNKTTIYAINTETYLFTELADQRRQNAQKYKQKNKLEKDQTTFGFCSTPPQQKFPTSY